MRSIDSILKNGLTTQQGTAILRVLTWSDLADYDANPATPDHTWLCTGFDIYSTRAKATLVTENDYTLSEFAVFIIERGLTINGVEYPIQSGLFFIRDYIERYGYIDITGSSYPNLKVSIAGDDTYQNVITAFCAAIGKTAVFKKPTDPWLAYQFLPTGRTVSLNKAEAFENMLRQKYCIHVYEESPKNLVFYNLDSLTVTTAPAKTWIGVTWSPELGLFCAVASGTVFMTSPDGNTWTAQNNPAGNNWTGICWSPELGLFCTVATTGVGNRVMTSPDGVNWTAQASAADNSWFSVCWSAELSLFVAVAYSGVGNRVMTSPDGVNWTAQASAADNNWYSVCWSADRRLFVAVASSGTGNRVMTSPDGVNWTLRTSPADNSWYSVCWSKKLNIFCAVATTGTGNRVMTSPDGINWTTQASAADNGWDTVSWSQELGLFCAVAYTGTGAGNRVMISPDGVNWSLQQNTDDLTWYGSCWSAELGLFCAVSGNGAGNRIMISPDGIHWCRTNAVDFFLTYQDGPDHSINRAQSEVYFFWVDEAETEHTHGTTTFPQWNLGYLESTDSPPTTHKDPYYKFYLQKAPLRLDITDGDKINFTPAWSIDPTKVIDAMVQVSEHFHIERSPTWYQEIRSIAMFDKTEGGALPSTIERVANYTPVNTSNFNTILTASENNVQAALDKIDDHTHASLYLPANADYSDISANDAATDVTGAELETLTDGSETTLHTHAGGGAMLFPGHGLNGTVGAGATQYTPPFFYGLNATPYNVPASRAGTAKNLSVRTNSAQPATGSLVITVMVNNAASVIVVTIPAGSAAGTFSDTTHSVAISQSDLLNIRVVNNASGASAAVGATSFELEL